jgi:hypothetical protein
MNRSIFLGAEAIMRVRNLWRYTASRTGLCCVVMVHFVFSQQYNGADLRSTEFAFYINRSGRRSRKIFLVHWEGAPTSFGESHLHSRTQLASFACALAYQYPCVLAFQPTFVGIRNVETGSMSQVIPGNNLRCLFNDTPSSLQQAHPRMSHSSRRITGCGWS